jgi:AcrR family transcriptional regulator
MTRLAGPMRREQLLDTGEKVFARLGYSRATTSELARSAGVTEPIIYQHFKSKRELFIALIERTAERTLRLWQQELAQATDPAERLRRLLGENPMVSPEHRAAYRVILHAMIEAGEPEIQRAAAEHIGRLHAFLAGEVKRAQGERKVTRVFTADLIAWLLIQVALGYGMLSGMDPPATSAEAEGARVRQAIERILVGRGRRARRGRGSEPEADAETPEQGERAAEA